VPTLLWGHGYSKNESTWRRRRRNALLQRSNGCIVYNHAAADRLVRDGVDRRSVFIALNAIDQAPVQRAVQRWREQPQELAGFQAKHGLGRELVLFVSRLVPEKRVDMLLEAFALVHRQRPNAQLAIIGRGPEETSLRQRAAALNISSAVIFAGAMYDEMDLAPWFLSARCMAYTVDLGLSILHAFGYGLPVITSDDHNLHGPEIEALRDEHNGLLYRLGDVDQFSAQILRCLADDQLQQRLAGNALATVQPPDGFCVQRMVRGLQDAITSARAAPASR
jgi:glycosyltransferase involved in cell wall biosynthesis